ncbi:hypothetical protein [Alistipes sp.]|uniref:hypothetical protein n=1 Tax=Alistipes sp. TaxID=1872444 RepID=UPI003AEF4026
MSRTFTHSSGVKIEYPNATHFAFVPAIVQVSGLSSADKLTLTVSEPSGSKMYREEREPNGGAVSFDMRRYLQLLFADTQHSRLNYCSLFAQSPLERTAQINVTWPAGSSMQAIHTFDVDAIWGAISARESSGGILRRRWFVRYPFTVDLFARSGTSFDIEVDGKRSDIVYYCHEADATGATAYHRCLMNPAKAIDPATVDRTVHIAVPHSLVLKNDEEAVGLVAYTLDIDRSASGVYLRWIDRQGRYCYYLFREVGSATTVTAASTWERNEMVVPTAYVNGVNVETPVRQSLARKKTRSLGAKLVDSETYDFLLTLAQSVVVDLFDGYDMRDEPLWHRVNVVPGSYERTPKRYQDFMISIEEPAQSAQTL